jgi:hypothetical protein
VTAGRERLRVLVHGYVDLNVVDGSAVFVPALARLLTGAPGVSVDVVSATPVRRAVVLAEALGQPRVSVVDPFHDATLQARETWLGGLTRLTEAQAALVVRHYASERGADVVVVRGTGVALELVRAEPDLAPRLCAYVTGVTHGDRPTDPVTAHALRELASAGATLLCQTEEMADVVADLLDGHDGYDGHDGHGGHGGHGGRPAVLPPAVPGAGTGTGAEVPTDPGHRAGVVAVYTGKFATAWNTLPMLSGFRQAHAREPRLRLVVAGDHFKPDPDLPSFAAEARHLLTSTPEVRWVGAVAREEARRLVAAADVGIGWRSAELDHSLELSTKVLENGVLGTPTILNPTPMHRRLFGEDYPLFASGTGEYVDVLVRCANDRDVVRSAAGRAREVAEAFSYGAVLERVLPVLSAAAGRGPGTWRDLLGQGGPPAGPADEPDPTAPVLVGSGSVRHDATGLVLPQPRDEDLERRLTEAEAEVASLRAALAAAEARAGAAERARDRLARSSLGRAQRAVWRLRSRGAR